MEITQFVLPNKNVIAAYKLAKKKDIKYAYPVKTFSIETIS